MDLKMAVDQKRYQEAADLEAAVQKVLFVNDIILEKKFLLDFEN